MQFYHVQDIFIQLYLCGQPAYKTFCQGYPLCLMIDGPKTLFCHFCSCTLAHIVTQCRHQKIYGRRCPIFSKCSLIQHHHRMDPYIPFRMCCRILFHADQTFKLRKPDIQLLHFTHFGKEHGRLWCLNQCLLQFTHNTFAGQSRQIHRFC